jgi:acyl-homoserine lactone acylase PvdQ
MNLRLFLLIDRKNLHLSRILIDKDKVDLETGYHIVGPGQSGHVKSKWYQNQMQDWTD